VTLVAPLSPRARKRLELAAIRFELTAAGRRWAKDRKARRRKARQQDLEVRVR